MGGRCRKRITNTDFFNSAFSAEEQSDVATTLLSADKNPYFPEIDQGTNTEDKVFLLSAKK